MSKLFPLFQSTLLMEAKKIRESINFSHLQMKRKPTEKEANDHSNCKEK
jgi:hypothetical protein